ncbi:MAG: DUF2752 domain-containing protein [Flavobacteriaceae bacterium]
MYFLVFSLNGIIRFLEEHMFTCFWKKMGMECMGCGMQRSIILLLKGEFVDAFYMYPPIYTIILLFSYLFLHLKFNFKIGAKILIGLFVLNIIVTIINYYYKFN